MNSHCIGLDIDKSTFKACLVAYGSQQKRVLGSRTFSNSEKGFDEFYIWSEKKVKSLPVSYVMEATGVYHEHLAYYLEAKKESVHIVLPLKSKRYLQSLGMRSKTDQIDAKGLAMMGLEQDLDVWQPASKQLLKLRSLTRQVEILQVHRTAFKSQLEGANHSAVMHKSVTNSLEQMITQVGKQIDKLEKEIGKLISSDKLLSEKYSLIEPLKGVGLMSFAVVVGETNGFALFKNQGQLVCYSGYDVLENQSGQRVGRTRISKKGNTHIRRILHLAAWSAVKNRTKPFIDLYERVYERTGIKMKAYVAVQRKLLVMIYTLWKKDEIFNPNFRTSGNQESKLLFSVDPEGSQNKTAKSTDLAALDGLPCNQSPKVLFSVVQT
jgi:transposase